MTTLKVMMLTKIVIYKDNELDTSCRDFLDVHIEAQMSAAPGSSFYGAAGQQHEEINLIGRGARSLSAPFHPAGGCSYHLLNTAYSSVGCSKIWPGKWENLKPLLPQCGGYF